MTLHRRWSQLFTVALFLVGGPVMIWSAQHGSQLRILFIPLGSGALFAVGAIATVGALWGLYVVSRGAPITLDEMGMFPRVSGINRFLPWAAVAAVILEPAAEGAGAPRLVLVPAPGVDLGVKAEYRNQVDGRPGVVLLTVDAVRESPEQIVEAFTRYAGSRFVNGAAPSTMEQPGDGPA
ncbi:hypothetical protein [Rhizomonospora bruguierae]|uniref:hypothetical protein n=1 Tax=Rhizomonospora bruguierae TaxID=1581705 RepID=UPI0020C16749|nr:hypothetical protein [Micromonospora sp. NBRC 107566]